LAIREQSLPFVQRVLESVPIRGKGRLAELLLKSETNEVNCHPVSGLTIHLDPRQRIERLMWAGAYEPSLVRVLKSLLKPGMVFLDLGANIGYFSAIAAALLGASGRVFAFEPSPACFERLQRNLRSFVQAVALQCALSDKAGLASLYLHPTESGWGSLLPASELTQRVKVNTIRLDDWAEETGLPRVDFLKVDIEGGEYAALLGGQAVLKRFRPIVFAELNSVCLSRDHRTPNDVSRLLLQLGYRCERNAESVMAIPA
jgi:FkbM family methyltransferase